MTCPRSQCLTGTRAPVTSCSSPRILQLTSFSWLLFSSALMRGYALLPFKASLPDHRLLRVLWPVLKSVLKSLLPCGFWFLGGCPPRLQPHPPHPRFLFIFCPPPSGCSCRGEWVGPRCSGPCTPSPGCRLLRHSDPDTCSVLGRLHSERLGRGGGEHSKVKVTAKELNEGVSRWKSTAFCHV